MRNVPAPLPEKRLSRGKTATILRALCRKRSRAAKPASPSRNDSRSPGREKLCASMLRGDICSRRRAPSGSAIWPSRPKSIRPIRIGSSRTCRSHSGTGRLPHGVGRRSAEPSPPPARQSLALPGRGGATKEGLRRRDLSRTVCLRQGLWTEDLRTPPEQECSNGSLILFAVVLWRTFLVERLSS